MSGRKFRLESLMGRGSGPLALAFCKSTVTTGTDIANAGGRHRAGRETAA